MHVKEIADRAVIEQGAIQKPAELAAFLSLLIDLDPKIVVEIGSDAGGTLWAWQQVCRRVIGIDKSNFGYSSGAYLNDHGCEIVYGDSHDKQTCERLRDLLGWDQVDMLFIDGDHTYDGVKADYEMYARIVRPGGIIGFHDVCRHPKWPTVQVNRFWASLDGDKEEIVCQPLTWGGIGVLRLPALVEAC